MDATYTGNKISSLRKEKNLTQKELAEKLHITDRAVSKWERGLNYPDLSLLPTIADVLETSVSELLGVEQNISNSTIDVISEISKAEKKQLLKIIRDYLTLAIMLGIGIIFNMLYIHYAGYVWEKYNIQFWINGILFALALPLITNGFWFLIKYKKLSVKK